MTVKLSCVGIEISSCPTTHSEKDSIDLFVFFRMTRTFSLGLVVALLLALAITEASRGRANQVTIIEVHSGRFTPRDYRRLSDYSFDFLSARTDKRFRQNCAMVRCYCTVEREILSRDNWQKHR